jgi:hypothetical protein|tara:strand:+ start:123 stop:347 length:225 start_codon:yes stop_codon:yes gene_type:complete
MRLKGLGDLVYIITYYTGFRWLVHKVYNYLGKDCGCDERQERWNRSVPFIKVEKQKPPQNIKSVIKKPKPTPTL